MLQNNRKTVFSMLFCPFLIIWAPPIGPKKVYKGPQVISMYGPMFKLKNKPPNQIIVLEDMVQNNQKIVFHAVFLPFCDHLFTPE
jgi:hypothetical protein